LPAPPRAEAPPSARTATAPLPGLNPQEPLPASARRALAALIVLLHLVGARLALEGEPVRRAVGEAMPIVIELIAPARTQPSRTEPAKPVPPRPQPPRPKPQARPLVVAEAAPSPSAPAFVVPPPEPPRPAPAAPDPGPRTPQPALAPAAPGPAGPPASPATVAINAVQYLTPPVLHYPPASRRAQEEGRVDVRVLVDAEGRPGETRVLRSSGYPRLDESALATVKATRFKPHTENGVPRAFWVVMPLIFEMEN
jgi:protein TonB